METTRLKSLLETLIFVSEGPLKVPEMLEALQNLEDFEKRMAPDESVAEEAPPEAESIEGEVPGSAADQLQSFAESEAEKIGRTDVQEALEEIAREYTENPMRGIVLTEVAQGWQFRTRPENAMVIREFYQPKPTKISKPSLETLAIVAYRQPITRVEIDEIRGVDSGGVLKTLLEKNLVRIVGKKDEPGKPMLYGTTQAFLELFQLKNLKDLPTLKEFRELEEEFQRKSGQEGVVVENTLAEEEEQDFQLDAAPLKEELAALEAEELEEIEDLEASIKNLRHLEKEIFAEEKKEGEDPHPPIEAEKSPSEEIANS